MTLTDTTTQRDPGDVTWRNAAEAGPDGEERVDDDFTLSEYAIPHLPDETVNLARTWGRPLVVVSAASSLVALVVPLFAASAGLRSVESAAAVHAVFALSFLVTAMALQALCRVEAEVDGRLSTSEVFGSALLCVAGFLPPGLGLLTGPVLLRGPWAGGGPARVYVAALSALGGVVGQWFLVARALGWAG